MSQQPPSNGTAIAETTRLQGQAAEPTGSRWVSANAGTGKTHVLVQRVLRLLLEGAKPDTILCLTYTNAAAAEMENRLFERLSTWAVMSEHELRQTLTRLLDSPPDPERMQLARTLFATTLETAGGLKVQTIHSFCERLLRRFPLEADISPNSSLLDDVAAREMKQAAIDQVLRKAAKRPDSRLGRALQTVIALASEESFTGLINETLGQRELIRELVLLGGSDDDPFAVAVEGLYAAFGLTPEDTESELRAQMATVLADNQIEALYHHLSQDAKGYAAATAENLMKARHAANERQRVENLRDAFMTKGNAPKKSLAKKDLIDVAPALTTPLLEAQTRFAELWRKSRSLRVARASEALLRLSSEIMQAYVNAKAQRAQLDFDDLIEKTNWLLQKSGGASWVLYKLDSGLDHILVDEAQDTSPQQWQLISKLTEEFFAGRGSHEDERLARTVFAVGDEKQSIYSFQGAQPKLFAEMRARMEMQAKQIAHDLPLIPLTLSFRSTSAVLNAVDAVFKDRSRVRGITFGNDEIRHGAVREGQHGLVEIWELERSEPSEAANVFDPLADLGKPEDPKEKLAERIARTIRHWLDNKVELPSAGRPIEPGDILILVRKRHPFTQPMIRALKRYDIPVAGADRMRINEQIAVEDLMALGDFLLLPEDDLSLATVLKSPLFGLTDDDLFIIRRDPADPDLFRKTETASERPRNIPLWWALKMARDKGKDPRYAEAFEQLARWMKRADKVPPYELFAGILDINGGREKLTSRLGLEAGDAINEFLAMALAFDENAPPALQAFLHQMRANNAEIKRDMEKGINEVRLMTVHGAKGLEANIVFLPDTTTRRGSNLSGRVRALDDGNGPEGTPAHLVWSVPKSGDVPQIARLKQERSDAEQEEYNRLLYVAMTRARDRLYVCGWLGGGPNKKLDETSWYALIDAGLAGLAVEATDNEGRLVRRFESGDSSIKKTVRPAGSQQTRDLSPPSWLESDAPAPPPPVTQLSPSKLLPAELAESRGESDPEAEPHRLNKDEAQTLGKTRGILVHALLQHLPGLPRDAQEDAARRIVAASDAELDDETRTAVIEEALQVLHHPEFAPLFDKSGTAEAAFNADLPITDKAGQPIRLSGQIDRLVVTDDEVIIVDYKTNRNVPADAAFAPAAYVMQLAAYRLAVRPLFPDKHIRCALLWTATQQLMELPEALLGNAEADLPRLARQ